MYVFCWFWVLPLYVREQIDHKWTTKIEEDWQKRVERAQEHVDSWLCLNFKLPVFMCSFIANKLQGEGEKTRSATEHEEDEAPIYLHYGSKICQNEGFLELDLCWSWAMILLKMI